MKCSFLIYWQSIIIKREKDKKTGSEEKFILFDFKVDQINKYCIVEYIRSKLSVNKNKMDLSTQITLRLFLQYIVKISRSSNNLQGHKRRLAGTIHKIEDYIQCFKVVDLDKKGVIHPKVLQNFLIKHKYYFKPESITLFFHKYSYQKSYISYEDLLQALLPHQDYLLVTTALYNVSSQLNRPEKFVYSCHNEHIKAIQYFTAFVLKLQIELLSQDYSQMRQVTRNSLQIGALLWRELDRGHNNQLNYLKYTFSYSRVRATAEELGIIIEQREWFGFLYWHFHSYKAYINREDFMRILNVQETKKRASSACKIQQFKVVSEIYKRAEEDRLRNIRTEKAIKQKMAMMPHLTGSQFRKIVKEEHFPFEKLHEKKQLKGKAGYSRPKNMVKYVIQRLD